jgi:SRSO17 transposase
VWNQVDLAVAAAASVYLGVFGSGWQELMGRICCRFGRVEPRRRAEDLVQGLASDLPIKNCWTLAEHVGAATPDGLQHLFAQAVWDYDGVRDDLRGYVVEHLGSMGGV